VTYWGTSDLIAGNGMQQRYYVNDRADGERDWGTFKGQVTTAEARQGLRACGNPRAAQAGLRGFTAEGTFRTRMTSPTEVEVTWEGQYQLAPSAKAA
jgi:hypothetical protein